MDRLRARAVAGKVRVEAEVKDARLVSTSDRIRLKSRTLPLQLECNTVNGRIDVEGMLRAKASFRLESVSGAIRIKRAGQEGFRVEARSRSGQIRVKERSKSRVFVHTEGDGGAELSIETFNGNIEIR